MWLEHATTTFMITKSWSYICFALPEALVTPNSFRYLPVRFNIPLTVHEQSH